MRLVCAARKPHFAAADAAGAAGTLPSLLRRRLLQNPAYYDLEDASPEGLSEYMSSLVEDALQALADSGCVLVGALDLWLIACSTLSGLQLV